MSSERPISGAEAAFAGGVSGTAQAAFGAVVALAVCVLTFRLGWQDFWWDEHVTLMFTLESWGDLMVTFWGLDTHRPVFYGVQKAWIATFGESVFAIRLLPVALTLAVVPALWATARQMGPPPLALFAGLILVTAPMFVYQGREIRMYCLMNLCLAVGFWLIVGLANRARAGEPMGLWPWIGFAGAMALGFYAHAIAAFSALILGVWGILAVALGLLPGRFLWAALGAGGLYVAMLLPALWPFFSHATGTLGGSFWLPEPSLSYIYAQMATAYGYPFWAKPIVLGLLLWGLWSMRGQRHLALLLGAFTLGLPALVIGVSFVSPVFMAKVVAWGNFVAAIPIAAGLLALRAPVLRWGGLAVVVVAGLLAAWERYPPAPEVTPYAVYAPVLAGFDPARDTLILGRQTDEPALRWYYPQIFEGAAFGFIPRDWNRNVIDAAFRSRFVPRAEAGEIVPGPGRLFVFRETAPPAPVAPDDAVDGALDTLTRGRGAPEITPGARYTLEVYPPL